MTKCQSLSQCFSDVAKDGGRRKLLRRAVPVTIGFELAMFLVCCSAADATCLGYPNKIENLNAPIIGLKPVRKSVIRKNVPQITRCLTARFRKSIGNELVFVAAKHDGRLWTYYEFMPSDVSDTYFVVATPKKDGSVKILKFVSVSGPAL